MQNCLKKMSIFRYFANMQISCIMVLMLIVLYKLKLKITGWGGWDEEVVGVCVDMGWKMGLLPENDSHIWRFFCHFSPNVVLTRGKTVSRVQFSKACSL